MALRKYVPSSGDASSLSMAPLNFSNKVHEKAQFTESETVHGPPEEANVDIDIREVYFLIMHFLSAGPCHRTYGQFWNELLEHQLLPRRYHAWYSRSGARSGDENDNGFSFPLSYNILVERYPHIKKDHLVKLLKQLILSTAPPLHGMIGGNTPNAADVPTLLGSGSFSLLGSDRSIEKQINHTPVYLRWPHMQADQVHGLSLREIGGGFSKHHRGPATRAACYAIARPSTMVQKMQNIKKIRGHRDAVYCAIFDRSGRYVITGSDDRLVKIWSMETAFCLASCRGHEGDITDLAVSSNNAVVASASNDCIIRVWRLPDGLPISVLRGHTGAVTAIAFSPRPSTSYHLLSSSDDGTCRVWDARSTHVSPRIYLPKPSDPVAGKSSGPSSSAGPQSHQILCCAYNANGTVFVTGSSDTFARVWNACKSNAHESGQPYHEMDVLSGHENDVNYVQFSGCAVASRYFMTETSKEENIPKFRNSWFSHDNIVTCSRDGSSIIWIPRSRKSHGKVGRWTRAYHLKVPPPPMPPQPPRGGPRQRHQPTPRGVNMIVWSLDNRFVLAAIMDCRICVWNAVDGSLVHSLTGHSESTYVLDVHPFNPRIAMSAGYDGKTIVWDIWEGTPIRVYEIGRFKLVDGKFSPDGTSIILSDDVGQLYILNTGQGESQKDAKYDQFFLGDYRPLIQDTHGNVLDQETQLAPYCRNIQDLLCDSSMIPYPEPYQSMYQQLRLGALGIERRPSSVKFAVGPVDINGLQDYQMVPLPDLDIMVEPLPEFIDAMDWEPENEVQSDDNDSEYNVPDEYSSEGEHGSIGTSSGDPDCSAEDSEVQHSHKDGLRRSKRKNHMGGFMTSSGRRVKKKNLDEFDRNLSENNRTRKSRNGPKASRKSSTSKSLRPQRVAARNARNLFSQITGASTDENDEGSSGSDSSDSETVLPNSNVQSNESDRSVQIVQQKNPRGKELSLDEGEDVVKPIELSDTQTNAKNKGRLVLKLPVRDSKKFVSSDKTRPRGGNQADLVGSSSIPPQEAIVLNGNNISSQDPGSSSGDLIDVLAQSRGGNKIREGEQSEKVEDHLGLSAGFQDSKIKWGEVKARTSKRWRGGNAMAMDFGSKASLDDHNRIGNNINGHLKPQSENGTTCPHSETQYPGDNTLRSPLDEHQRRGGASLLACNGNINNGYKAQSGPIVCVDYDEPPELASHFSCKNESDHSQDVKENSPPIPTKLGIRSKTILHDADSSTKLKSIATVEDWKSSACDSMSQSLSQMDNDLTSGVPKEEEATCGPSLDHGEWNGLRKSEAQIDKNHGLPNWHDSRRSLLDSNHNMNNAVYRRSKSQRSRNTSEIDGDMEGSTSNDSSNHLDPEMEFPEATTDGARRTRSMGMRATTREPHIGSSKLKVRGGYRSVQTSSGERFSMNPHEQLQCEEWRSNSRMTVGLRSARSRRENYYDCDLSTLSKRNSHHSVRKLTWLMLLEHEENYRYIPQLGDEVAYLRQGHEGYIKWCHSSEIGPWRSLKGNLRAVEFCKVEGLDYSTLPGSGESCCKITLDFVDPSSSVFGKTFKLTLPELNDFSDFLVERTRYDGAINRNWTYRDKCQVWWRNEHEDGGSWWEGRVVTVKPSSFEFPDSPWERYTIQYKSDAGQHQHSPWELHDPDIPFVHPHINDEIRNRLMSSFSELEQSMNRNQDHYGLQKLKQVSQKSDFLNRFPVPLSFEVIQSRLEHNYYRSLDATKHDFTVMLWNAQSYFGRNTELEAKMRRLSRWFNEELLPL